MPAPTPPLPRWAPRVNQADIRRLYECDAQGIYDGGLLDEVGMALYMRCASFIAAVEAVRGRAQCPQCGAVVLHGAAPAEVLHCAACGWELPWSAYFGSLQHKQLSGADAVLDLFCAFQARFAAAQAPRDKMLAIDALIHGFHYDLKLRPTRTVGVNLIEGNYHQVVAFLDGLTHGEKSAPETRQTWREWRETVHLTGQRWGDERLRLQKGNS
jgi:hypothetical protein